VDSNNADYSSEDGVLFNKVKTVLVTYPAKNSRTSYSIPNSVTNIYYEAFGSCNNITSIIIPDSVTSISNKAFYSCVNLTNVTIGNGLTQIDSEAFKECSNLESITCNAATAPTISSSAFQYVKANGTLTVPQGSTGYDTWMGSSAYYLGYSNWTKVEQ